MTGQAFRFLAGAIIFCAAISISALDTTSAASGKDVILIGATLSNTGQHATNGKHTRRGCQLAVNLINENGGVSVGGKKFELKIK